MRAERVLDREVVQAELALHLAEERLARLVQADPDELIGLLERSASVLEREVGDTAPARVRRAIDDALVDVVSGSRAGRILN